jgi:hypothetical protein
MRGGIDSLQELRQYLYCCTALLVQNVQILTHLHHLVKLVDEQADELH